MEPVSQAKTVIKSALFVDFDNIYIGLSKTDPLAAERFASDPARWLAWLEQGLMGIPSGAGDPILPQEGGGCTRRSILVRRCYPNPDAGFRRYRSFFTSAAFSVIDCPTLTRTGKNSSDIYMVMDILDILNHKTYFDEFIIFSGDSDFMPVLLRLRAHDRRTTTLAIDYMPPAFKAACDLVISEEEFIEDALGIPQEGPGSNGILRARLELPVLKDMAQRVYDTVRQEGEVAGAELPDILKDFREFRESSNWLGFGTSQRLAEALAHQEPRLRLVRVNQAQYKLSYKEGSAETARAPLAEAAGHRPEPAQPPVEEAPAASSLAPAPARAPAVERLVAASSQLPSATSQSPAASSQAHAASSQAQDLDLRRQIISAVREVVGSSENAVLLARASQYVVSKVGPRVLDSQWAGTGSFKKLLLGIDDLGLEITSQPEPGYIYDPARHTHPSLRGPRRAAAAPERLPEAPRLPTAGKYATPSYPAGMESGGAGAARGGAAAPVHSLEEFARRVSQVTGVPLLDPEQYALVFHGIHAEMQQIAEGDKTYNTYQSAKSVSDWCAGQGRPVSHNDIVLIFKGIIFQDGARFGKQPGSYSPQEVARVIRDNILALCQRSRLELSDEECCMLDTWILGGLGEGAPCEAEGEQEAVDE